MKKLSLFVLALTTQAALASHPVITGFYLEGALGGTQLEVDLEHQSLIGNSPDNFFATFPMEADLGNGNTAGWLGVGYAYELKNHLVFGLEATAGFDNPRLAHQDGFSSGSLVKGKVETKLKNDFALLFKAGYLIMGHTQIYGLLGPRWGNFQSSLTTEISPSPAFSVEHSGYVLGVTAGLGMEHWVSNHITLGLEYAYTSYGSLETLSASALIFTPSAAIITDAVDQEASTNTIVAKLAYHF